MISVKRELFTLDNFDFYSIIDQIETEGATSVKILREDFRRSLLWEAQSYSYTPEPEVVGTSNQVVRRQVGSFAGFPLSTQYSRLKDALVTIN